MVASGPHSFSSDRLHATACMEVVGCHQFNVRRSLVAVGHNNFQQGQKNSYFLFISHIYKLLVFRTSAPTSKFACGCSGFRMGCSVGTRFILVWQNLPISNLRRLALLAPLLLNARSRGYKRGREDRRAPKSLMCGWT
jgi:hypothetical protein